MKDEERRFTIWSSVGILAFGILGTGILYDAYQKRQHYERFVASHTAATPICAVENALCALRSAETELTSYPTGTGPTRGQHLPNLKSSIDRLSAVKMHLRPLPDLALLVDNTGSQMYNRVTTYDGGIVSGREELQRLHTALDGRLEEYRSVLSPALRTEERGLRAAYDTSESEQRNGLASLFGAGVIGFLLFFEKRSTRTYDEVLNELERQIAHEREKRKK